MPVPDQPLRPPPPLPARLLALAPIVYVGTGVWVLAGVVLLVADTIPRVWLWTSVSGATLGILGILLILWQRRAARRGSKGAQKVS
ncbi:hypothetical protein [Alloactinosynnema sp. L-07]|uniref:DUF2530 domain-containing protein n=1 Tax=Alloactinosynnema sp. L-07 TaxID=1653480 RepID=UPI00065EF749|nr:DUF2530 domain-containing protein [Alloactinosynnema sp. L-07]CRK61316.1 hypothetical protein [Alloactinosynnema sp. L-07]